MQVGQRGHTYDRSGHRDFWSSKPEPSAGRRARLSRFAGRIACRQFYRMYRVARSQLGRLVVTPFATIGVLAAVLVWEVEHVGSILLAIAIAAGAVAIGVVVARQMRRDIDRIADYYGGLLRTADEQSRQAETANRLKDDFLSTLSH